MPRRLTEAAAWRKVARIVDDPGWGAGFIGLCWTIAEQPWLPQVLVLGMRDRLHAHMQDRPVLPVQPLSSDEEQYGMDNRDGYVDRPGRRESRVLACLWMALEAEEEGR